MLGSSEALPEPCVVVPCTRPRCDFCGELPPGVVDRAVRKTAHWGTSLVFLAHSFASLVPCVLALLDSAPEVP